MPHKPNDQTSQNTRKMKISLLLVVATLALVPAEQSKLWKMFKKMVMKTEGDQKQELQEMMQMKKTLMKVILNILLVGDIKLSI